MPSKDLLVDLTDRVGASKGHGHANIVVQPRSVCPVYSENVARGLTLGQPLALRLVQEASMVNIVGKNRLAALSAPRINVHAPR